MRSTNRASLGSENRAILGRERPAMTQTPFVRPPIVHRIDIDSLAPDQLHRFRVVMTENATGNESLVPVMVMRSIVPGPTVGFTAAIHGNELNGIPVIHRLLQTLTTTGLKSGTVLAAPILNIPGYLRQQREFEDGVDLNRIMPGSPGGDESSLYAHRLVERVLKGLDYLIDLHTASFGRVNSLYVRADMRNPETARLARLIAPQIIVHSPGGDGTLRAAAANLGIRAITVEVGNPLRFQDGLVRATRLGLQEVLEHLGVIGDISDPLPQEVTECSGSYWLYTDRGGILNVFPSVADRVSKGERVAELHNVWGDQVRVYTAPEDGVVIGKSTNPAARAGSRIIHLGVISH
jgi:hypothetical protein